MNTVARTAPRIAIDDIESQMRARIAEIESELEAYEWLLAERERLQRALRTLNEQPPQRATAGRRSVPRGANRAQVLRFLKDHPSSSAAQVIEATGIQRNVAYNLLRRLVIQGAVSRLDDTDGRARYSAADAALSVKVP
jgi:sugar-specific transcriptional regulator TrmB